MKISPIAPAKVTIPARFAAHTDRLASTPQRGQRGRGTGLDGHERRGEQAGADEAGQRLWRGPARRLGPGDP